MLIKVCCIQDASELAVAVEAGATHVGLVGAMPSGPGPITDDAIRCIASTASDDVRTVLLTSRTDVAGIVGHVEATGVRAVQIVSPVDAEVRRGVRAAVPRLEILQVVHVEGPEALGGAQAAAEAADYVLLDSGRPFGAIPQLGGTGRTHDWVVSERIVSRLEVPVFLAGGLDPKNVGRAIGAVRPAGVDVCSGLRDATGRLDPRALGEFVRSVRTA